jgi:uncharacterized protein YjbI with pentapeptide repeats
VGERRWKKAPDEEVQPADEEVQPAKMSFREWLGVGERRWKKAPDEEVQPAKTLWDWMQLVLVPAILIGVTFVWSAAQTRSDNKREDRRSQDAILASYLTEMSGLTLDKKLLSSKEGDPIRTVARTATLTVLHRLDGDRKEEVVHSLIEAGLLIRDCTGLPIRDCPIVQLPDADLRGANFNGADLRGTDLHVAHLEGAHLEGAQLTSANLLGAHFEGAHLGHAEASLATIEGAYLAGADLNHADLTWANLNHADLTGANLTGADLTGANLTGAKGLPKRSSGDG